MASKRRNMIHKNKMQETTEKERLPRGGPLWGAAVDRHNSVPPPPSEMATRHYPGINARRRAAEKLRKSGKDRGSGRQRYWSGWVPPGLTVDELVRYRRRRPPIASRPPDNLQTPAGTFEHVKTEYRRIFKRSATYLKAFDGLLKRTKLKPQDLLFLEGQVIYNPEYKESFVAYPPAGRPTPFKPKEELEKTTKDKSKLGVSETSAKFVVFERARRGELQRRPTTLKPEGDFLVKESEGHEQFRGYGSYQRPPLTRAATALKLEGEQNTTRTESSEKFVEHPVHARVEPVKPEVSLKVSEEAMSLVSETLESFSVPKCPQKAQPVKQPGVLQVEGVMNYAPEYREQFVEFPRSRPVVKKQDDTLRPEGRLETTTSELKAEFVDFPRERNIAKPPEAHLRQEGNIDTVSEIKAEYKEYPRERNIAKPLEDHLKMEGELEKISELKAEFKDFPRSRPIIHRTPSVLKQEGEIGKTTELRSEFREFPRQRNIAKPHEDNLRPEGEIGKESEIRAEYKDFPRQRPVIYRTPSVLKPEGEIEVTTEAMSEYKHFPSSRPVLQRKNSELKASDGDIEKESETHKEFKDFPRQRPVLHRMNSLLKTEGQIEKVTEAKAEYKDFPRQRPVLQRTDTQLKPMEGKMEATSELKAEFKDFPRQRPVILRPVTTLRPTEVVRPLPPVSPRRQPRTPAGSRRGSGYLHLEGEIQIRPETGGYSITFEDEAPSYSTFPRSKRDRSARQEVVCRTAPCGGRSPLPQRRVDHREAESEPEFRTADRSFHVIDVSQPPPPKDQKAHVTFADTRQSARRVANVVGRDDTSSTSSSTSDSVVGGVGRIRPQIVGVAAPRPRVEPQPTNDKSFVVLQDDNNNYYRRKTLEPVSTAWEPAPTVWEPPAGGCGTSRWLKNNRRGSSRPWTPSWAQPT